MNCMYVQNTNSKMVQNANARLIYIDVPVIKLPVDVFFYNQQHILYSHIYYCTRANPRWDDSLHFLKIPVI